MTKTGFTLIEVLLVCAILALVVVPTYRTFDFSSDAFEKSISRNTTMQTGQNIVNMLRDDLSAASLMFEKTASKVDINDILKVDESGFIKTFEFYSFNEPVKIGDKFEKKVNRIKYVFDGNDNTLKRIIYYNGRPDGQRERTLLLSKDVNYFELLAVLGDSQGVRRSFFRPYFQLVEPQKKKTQEPVIREFMTTIIPETFNSLLAFEGFNRNYNTDPE